MNDQSGERLDQSVVTQNFLKLIILGGTHSDACSCEYLDECLDFEGTSVLRAVCRRVSSLGVADIRTVSRK